MSFDVKDFGVELTRSLSETLSEGWLHDPQSGEPVQKNQYAQTCFAVAALRAGAITNDDSLREAGTRALQAYLEIPDHERGHQEFNSFAITELFRDRARKKYELPLLKNHLTDALEYKSDLTTQQGNNWLLLRIASELELSALGIRSPSRFLPLWLSAARSWIQSDGTIIDSPRIPISPPETPLTYHAKMTYTAAMIARHREPWESVALNGAKALYEASLPNGESLYFGRSENTIFGYACVLGATSELVNLGYSQPWLTDLASRTAQYIESQFNPSEPAALPQSDSIQGEAIDDYVYDSVYAAYAAMVLLNCTVPNRDGIKNRTNKHLDDIGISVWTGSSSAVGIAISGQYKHTQGRPDPRYAGMIPHTFTYERDSIFPGMPRCAWESPSLPFLPTVYLDNNYYTPVTWSIQSIASNTIRGTGEFFLLQRTGGDSDSPSKELPSTVETIAKRAFLPLVRDRQRKQPSAISASVERAIHYIPFLNALVIQTNVDAEGGKVIPSSYLLKNEFRGSGSLEMDSSDKKVSNQVTGHRGSGIWVRATELVSDCIRTAIVLNPSNRLDDQKTSFSENMITTSVYYSTSSQPEIVHLKPDSVSSGCSGV